MTLLARAWDGPDIQYIAWNVGLAGWYAERNAAWAVLRNAGCDGDSAA